MIPPVGACCACWQLQLQMLAAQFVLQLVSMPECSAPVPALCVLLVRMPLCLLPQQRGFAAVGRLACCARLLYAARPATLRKPFAHADSIAHGPRPMPLQIYMFNMLFTDVLHPPMHQNARTAAAGLQHRPSGSLAQPLPGVDQRSHPPSIQQAADGLHKCFMKQTSAGWAAAIAGVVHGPDGAHSASVQCPPI